MPISTSIKIGVASLGIVGATTAFVYSKRDKIKETWSKLSPKKKFAVKVVATAGGGAVLGLCLGHGYLVGKAAYVTYQAGMWAFPVGLVVAAKRTFMVVTILDGINSGNEIAKKIIDAKAKKAAKAEVKEDAPEEEVVTIEKKSKSPNKAQAVAEEIGADDVAAQFIAEHTEEQSQPVSRALRRKQANRKDVKQAKPRHHKDPLNKAKIEWSPDQNGEGEPMIRKFEE